MALSVTFVDDVSALDLSLSYAELMAVAFGESATRWADVYRCKHHENPFGGSYAALVFESDRLVAMNLFWKWEFSQKNKVVRAAQSCDLAVHPDYRGTGLFSAMHKTAMARIPKNVIRYAVGPNANSAPGFRKFGLIFREEYRTHLFVVNVGRFGIQRVIRRVHDFLPRPRETDIDLGGNLNDFLARVRCESPDWITNYTADVISWRLRLNKTLRAEIVLDRARTVGLLIYSLSELSTDPTYRLLSLVDVICAPLSDGVAAVAKHLQSLVERHGISEIQTATTKPSELLAKVAWHVRSRPGGFTVDPTEGWTDGLSMEQFMSNSRLTSFDSDHI